MSQRVDRVSGQNLVKVVESSLRGRDNSSLGQKWGLGPLVIR